MSVVAFDGRTIAADRQCTIAGRRVEATKLWQPNGNVVIAAVGHWQGAAALRGWYVAGADPALFPKLTGDAEATIIVARRYDAGIEVCVYEHHMPVPVPITGPAAWGAGSDFALGAMAMDANARRAVEITNEYCVYCGLGVDHVDLRELYPSERR